MAVDALTKVLSKRAPKTRKGRQILKKRESQVVEEAKTALIVRGNRSSNEVSLLLRDLHTLRAPLARLFMRKHDEHPFEDVKRLEKLCQNYDHSLFAFGSSAKKRPFRLILGRLFCGTLLDMQEFGIEEYKSMQSFPASSNKESVSGSKPLMVFQGTAFETDDRMKRAKSLLLDFFSGPRPDKVVLQGLDQVIVCSTVDTPGSSAPSGAGVKGAAQPSLLFRRYRVNMTKSGSRLPRVELEEMGPSMKMILDRTKEPERERWKSAIKVPKAAKPKKVKNVKTITMGKTTARIHLGKQLFDNIHTVHHGKAKSKKLTVDLARAAQKKGVKGKTASPK